ncbi:MAG TPA: ribosome biogenesis GTP-binding protein YihA/YsxC [Burkholderiales bacterium]
MSQPGLFQDIAFFTTVAAEAELPGGAAAEVAFAGRSNAGKSSAINALANRNRLAFVSKTPGRTQHINYFSMGSGRYLVDLPGYGYAKVPRDMKLYWETLIAGYLRNRGQLRGLVVVMDIRHPLTELDIRLIEWFAPSGKPIHVLLTKADKLNRQQANEQLGKVREALADIPAASAQLFSAPSRMGAAEAELRLAGWFQPVATPTGG